MHSMHFVIHFHQRNISLERLTLTRIPAFLKCLFRAYHHYLDWPLSMRIDESIRDRSVRHVLSLMRFVNCNIFTHVMSVPHKLIRIKGKIPITDVSLFSKKLFFIYLSGIRSHPTTLSRPFSLTCSSAVDIWCPEFVIVGSKLFGAL